MLIDQCSVPKGIICQAGRIRWLWQIRRVPRNWCLTEHSVLGICYGQQTMCQQLGGGVEPVMTVNLAVLILP